MSKEPRNPSYFVIFRVNQNFLSWNQFLNGSSFCRGNSKIHPTCPCSITHILLVSSKLPAYTLFFPAHIVRLQDILSTFLLKIVKIIFVQSFVSINFRTCFPLFLLAEERDWYFWNFPCCMLYSILHTLFYLYIYLIDWSVCLIIVSFF